MPQRYSSSPELKEKIAAALCYLPSLLGFVIGVVYILVKGPGCNGPFFRFHFYQAIFLSIVGFLIMAVASGSTDIFVGFLRLFEGALGPSLIHSLVSNISLVTSVLLLPVAFAVIYAAIFAFLGKFTKIPMVTDVIYNMIR